jgi:hypothetical protein
MTAIATSLALLRTAIAISESSERLRKMAVMIEVIVSLALMVLISVLKTQLNSPEGDYLKQLQNRKDPRLLPRGYVQNPLTALPSRAVLRATLK